MRRALLLLLAACEAPAPSTPIVSVLKRGDTCFALMTPDIPPAPELAVASVCDDPVEPTLLAAVDQIEVVIDYGPDVDFARSTMVPPPTVELIADGASQDVATAVSGEMRIGTRAFFLATFRTPDVASNDVRIRAGVDQGFQTEVPVVFTVLPPPIAFSIGECVVGMACGLTSAVGVAHARVAVPGDVALPVVIRQTLDGAPLTDVVTATIPQPSENVAEVALPVPIAHPGAVWNLVAQVGHGASAPITASLAKPAIVAALSCGTSCTLARDTEVGLAITAPAGIEAIEARVTTRIDGVPQIVDQPISLAADGTGTGTLVTPGRSGTWQIDVTVAGFAAPSLTAAIQ